MSVHAQAADSHEIAAELFGRLRKPKLAAAESERAAAERRMYASQLARRPEWAHVATELVEPRR